MNRTKINPKIRPGNIKSHYYKPKNIGIYGERVAEHYLRSKGHAVLAKNLRLKCGEIDILSFKNKVIYIIEVKTACLAADSAYKDREFKAEDNLSKTKILKLRRLRRELSYWIESGQAGIFLSDDASKASEASGIDIFDVADLLGLDIQIDGIAVDISLDKASNTVSRIKVRHFPHL